MGVGDFVNFAVHMGYFACGIGAGLVVGIGATIAARYSLVDVPKMLRGEMVHRLHDAQDHLPHAHPAAAPPEVQVAARRRDPS